MLDENQRDLFERYRARLTGLPVSHIWAGDGPAIFLEFGTLTPSTKRRRDGSRFNDRGEFSVMIDSAWRLESDRNIGCGSGFELDVRTKKLNSIIGRTVNDLLIIDHIFELGIYLSQSCTLFSFSDCSGNPEWAIFDNVTLDSQTVSISMRGGSLVEETSPLRQTGHRESPP